jgi:hypothetical protein
MIVDGENTKPHTFILKNGKEIKTTFFQYISGSVYGRTTAIDNNEFSFKIDELSEIKKLDYKELPKKKPYQRSKYCENKKKAQVNIDKRKRLLLFEK